LFSFVCGWASQEGWNASSISRSFSGDREILSYFN
jgi:hypothetical protein